LEEPPKALVGGLCWPLVVAMKVDEARSVEEGGKRLSALEIQSDGSVLLVQAVDEVENKSTVLDAFVEVGNGVNHAHALEIAVVSSQIEYPVVTITNELVLISGDLAIELRESDVVHGHPIDKGGVRVVSEDVVGEGKLAEGGEELATPLIIAQGEVKTIGTRVRMF